MGTANKLLGSSLARWENLYFQSLAYHINIDAYARKKKRKKRIAFIDFLFYNSRLCFFPLDKLKIYTHM